LTSNAVGHETALPTASPTTTNADFVPGLPSPAVDQLTALMNSGDIGAAIAAMVMQSKKELRQSARTSRDAAYAAQEAAQRQQLAHMRSSAEAKFTAGIVSGGATVLSAASSFTGSVTDGKVAAAFTNGSKAIDGTAKMWSSQHELASSLQDQRAKASGMAAETAERVAESHSDDVKDADESLKKCLEFLKEWLSAKDAARSAAVHRA
jgi:hypothetical protein